MIDLKSLDLIVLKMLILLTVNKKNQFNHDVLNVFNLRCHTHV